MGSIVMKYGLLPPTLNADIVQEQLNLAHTYRKRLVEIERERRSLMRAALEEHGVRDMEESIKQLYSQKKKGDENKKHNLELDRQARDIRREVSRIRSLPSVAKKFEEINGKKKDLGEGKKTVSELRKDKTPNTGIAAKAVRAARADSGVFWGTYLKVEAAAKQSANETPHLYDGNEDNNPRFPRRDGGGCLAVQIQNGVGLEDRVIIAPVDELALTSPKRSERRKAARTTLRMAVAGTSKGNSEYTFAEWPMVLHRPIPKGRITWVSVTKTMVGPKAVWTCEVTVDTSSSPRVVPSNDRVKAVAVSLGWRRIGDKVRVAHWMSTEGKVGYLDILDSGLDGVDSDGGKGGIVDGIRKSDELKSIRDKNHNQALSELVGWLRLQEPVPQWVLDSTCKRGMVTPSKPQAMAHMAQWKSQARLAAFAKRWRENRFGNDSEAFDALEKWRYHDYHLWVWERRQRVSGIRRRREVYRRFSADLAKRFVEVIVDGSNFKELKEKEDTGRGQKMQTIGQVVACGEMRLTLKNAASSHGSDFVKAEPKNTATSCPRCGSVNKHQRGEDHNFACMKCPLVRDVATVRLLNMLNENGHPDSVAEILERSERVGKQLNRKVESDE